MTNFNWRIEEALDGAKEKIAMKRRLLAGVRDGWQEPGKGMTKEETIRALIQSIAEQEAIINWLRSQNHA